MYQSPKSSPFKTKEYQRLENHKQNLVKKLLIIFTHYAGKVSKYNYIELHEKYFMEMVMELFAVAGKEGELIRNTPEWVCIQNIYYSKGRKHPLDFNQFLQILPSLAHVVSEGEHILTSRSNNFIGEGDQANQMKALLKLFDLLYNQVIQLELFKKGVKSQEINADTKQFLVKLKDSFSKLYKVYFSQEITLKYKEKDYYHKSFENYLQFMKDFEIYPKLISSSNLFFIFNEVINDQNNLSLLHSDSVIRYPFEELGEHFTLTKFVQSLIVCSKLCLFKLKKIDLREGEELHESYTRMGLTQKDIVKLLLEYMETIKSLKKKLCKFSRERFTLIVYEEYANFTHTQHGENKSMLLSHSLVKGPNESRFKFYQILDKIDI